jgi:hypothetical protein
MIDIMDKHRDSWSGRLTVALGACLLLCSLPAFAQGSPWAYVTAMTGPLDRIEACFEELGVPQPKALRRETIEDEMPFIGPGGLRGTGTLGMWMGPGEPGSTKPGGVLIFPVNPDAAKLKEFTSRGARPVSGSSDTVRIQGTFLRRTEGFLLMGPMEKYITHLDPMAAQEHLSAPGTLAEVDINFDLWRKTDPSTFYSIMQDKDEDEEPAPSFRHAEELGRSMVMRVYEKQLSRMRLTLMDGGTSLHLRVGLEPFAPGEIAPLPRPAFPHGIIGRVDVAYSSAESSQWLKEVTEELMNAAEKDNLFANLERKRVNVDQVRALFKEAFEIFWIADAISIAVEPLRGQMIYHQVNQYRSPGGFTARLAAVVKKINELDRQQGSRKGGLGLTTYNASGVRISRLTFPSGKLTLDFVDSETTVRIVAASDTRRRLPDLIKAPADGTLTSGFSGALDVNAMVDAMIASGTRLPLPLRSRESLRGQLITWTTTAEGRAATVDFDVPKPLVQAFLQLAGSRPFEMEASEP